MGKRWTRFLAAAAATATALTLWPPLTATAESTQPQPSPYSGRVGMASHLFWLSEADARAQMQPLADAGVRAIREDFRWDQLEPTKGSFRWQRADNLMAAAAATGVDVLAILDYSASWASSDPTGAGGIHYPPKNAGDYANFAAAVVARYGKNGSFWATRPDLTPRPLEAVQIWNEPWGYWFWKSGPDPAAYARLTRAAATAVRASHPEVKVVAAGDLLQVRTDKAIVSWVENVLNADPTLPSLLDGWSVHPYPDPRTAGPNDPSDPRWTFARVALVRDITVARGAGLPLWLTEFGWSTATASGDGVSEATQASYISTALSRAVNEWGSFVKRSYVYSWDKSNGVMTDREGNYGLRRADGTTKPAWDAIVALLRTLAADTGR